MIILGCKNVNILNVRKTIPTDEQATEKATRQHSQVIAAEFSVFANCLALLSSVTLPRISRHLHSLYLIQCDPLNEFHLQSVSKRNSRCWVTSYPMWLSLCEDVEVSGVQAT